MNKYTFFWLSGEKNVLAGDSPADAFKRAGYGSGAIRAIDFYSEGECDDYWYDKGNRSWVKVHQKMEVVNV